MTLNREIDSSNVRDYGARQLIQPFKGHKL